MKYIYPCKPKTLAPDSSLFDKLDRDKEWIAEVKKNGWRCMVYREADGVRLMTRHNTIIKEPLPVLRGFLEGLPVGTVLDGEFIHYRTEEKGRLYLFDILMREGVFVMGLPLRRRRELLEGFDLDHPDIELAEWVRVGKKVLYYKSIEGKLNEGVVLKKLSSKYLGSYTRCMDVPWWLKVKKPEDHVFMK